MKKGLIHLAAVAALLTVSFVQAEARDWSVLGKDATNIHYLYEPQSVLVVKDVVSAWTSKQFNVPGEIKSTGLAPYQYGGDKYTVSYQEFNCQDKTIKVLSGVTYDSKGMPLGDLPKGKVEPVVAGSPDAFLLEGLCKIAQKKQGEQKAEGQVETKVEEKK